MFGDPERVEQAVRDVAALLRDADNVLFITGAGVSADSGLPTYRGVGGLYDGGDTEDDIPIEEALSGPMFARRPELTWKYLWQIGSACLGASPNAAHEIIAAIQREKPEAWVVTQNIDGLHRQAGSRRLVEVHGHMHELFCVRCGREYSSTELLSEFRVLSVLPPKCLECEGIVRPRVVLFGESLSADAVRSLHRLAETRFDLVLAIGTSAVFPYIKQPVHLAASRGKPSVEINPSRTVITPDCRYRIPLGAADAMERIRACMF